ncbi:MAG: phosphoribosyltransferase [Alphaproteobacteria bacterium]
MNFRSYNDLAHLVKQQTPHLPQDIGLVVYVPRSGIIPATQIALQRNIALIPLQDFLAGAADTASFSHRNRRLVQRKKLRVLVVDDSFGDGTTLKKVQSSIANARLNEIFDIEYLCVYWSGVDAPGLTYWWEKLARPRLFEWNIFHHKGVGHMCFDIDGVLCCDPSSNENDDGKKYQRFIETAWPQIIPTHKVGWLVTSRLEKYRTATEDWLATHNITYDHLIMWDGISAETRRIVGQHGRFKGQVYRDCSAELFVESESHQAYDIAQVSGKPALCTDNMTLYQPDMNQTHHYINEGKSLARRIAKSILRIR